MPETEFGEVETSGDWQTKVSAGIAKRNEKRRSALKAARAKGGIPLLGVMRERRASRRRILNEARDRLVARGQEHESSRRARASVWLATSVKGERRWCRKWDAVMSEMPVGPEKAKAFLGGKWTLVAKGHRAGTAPEPAPTDVQAHSCFSAFLEANEDEEEDDVVPDPPTVTVGNGVPASAEPGTCLCGCT